MWIDSRHTRGYELEIGRKTHQLNGNPSKLNENINLSLGEIFSKENSMILYILGDSDSLNLMADIGNVIFMNVNIQYFIFK